MTFTEDYGRGLTSLFASARAFAGFAQRLGVPTENPDIPTARVSFDPEVKRILFEINPDFIEPLTDSEVAAVIAHETYHVLLRHFDSMFDTNTYPDKESLEEACECIINDGLIAHIGHDLPEGHYSGPEYFEQDFSWFSTREGYDFIVNKKKSDSEKTHSSDDNEDADDNDDSNQASSSKGSTDDSDSQGHNHQTPTGCSGFDIDEKDYDDFKEEVARAINRAIGVQTEELPEDVSDMLADFNADPNMPQITQQWSIGHSSSRSTAFVQANDSLNLNWKFLLAKINPKILSAGRPKYRDSWHAPRRKMISSYPDVILPTRRKDPHGSGRGSDVPRVILALDMSYSIPDDLIEKLASLADSIPSDIIVPEPVTWSDWVMPFDSKTRGIVARAGTNIDAVFNYAAKREVETGGKPYVIVITDGDCRFGDPTITMTPKNMETLKSRWFWVGIESQDVLMIKSRFSQVITPNNVYALQDFI